MNAVVEKAKALLESKGYVVHDPVSKDDMEELLDRLYNAMDSDRGAHDDDVRVFDALIVLVKEHGP